MQCTKPAQSPAQSPGAGVRGPPLPPLPPPPPPSSSLHSPPHFLSPLILSPHPPRAAMDSFNETQGDTGRVPARVSLREAIKEKKGA